MSTERYIPFTKQDIISLCLDHNKTLSNQPFTQVCALLSSLFHFQYHHLLENLKESYEPFNPNSATRTLTVPAKEQLVRYQKSFVKNFEQVLNAANFEKITNTDLQEALNEESLFKVRLEVKFSDFEEIVFYRRGESEKTETISKFFGLIKEPITFVNYDRVAVYIKFKSEEHFTERKLPLGCIPGSTVIKLFQNVPKADLEMLFPNSEIRMRPIDKVVIGTSAIIGGGIVLVTKLGASLILLATLLSFWVGMSDEAVEIGQKQLIALLLGLGVFGSFIFKEWSKFKNRKIKFMKALADNLYYKNLDNNAGVFHTLVNEAEEEDFKEAILAYSFLLKHEKGLTAQALDKEIEQVFEEKYQCTLDFEITDALEKLERFGLVYSSQNVYQAIDVNSAKIVLDQHWDKLF